MTSEPAAQPPGPAATAAAGHFPSGSEPVVSSATVTFRLADPYARLLGVRLQQDLGIREDLLEFSYQDSGWTLTVARPPVNRMEYLLELRQANGVRETVVDPANPLRAPGAFGEKSVIEFPQYRPPSWLGLPRARGRLIALDLASRQLEASVRVEVWSPTGLDGPAPLLVVHDGPEYARLGGLLDFVAARLFEHTLPPLRVALLAPQDRTSWYAVDPDYAGALAREVLPALARIAASTVRVGVGASLGALAMLHAHRAGSGLFDGLLLQSGSFFTPELDPQEQRFPRFGQVTRFVQELNASSSDSAAVPVAMTCGALEENLANNQAMAATLRRLGYSVQLQEVADVHNFTAWRDALDPSLTQLLHALCGAEGAAGWQPGSP